MSRMFKGSSIAPNPGVSVEGLLDTIINKKKAEIQSKFNQFDKQNLGYIRIQDFQQRLQDLGLNPDREDIREILDDLDSKKSGKIEIYDFTRLISAPKPTVVTKAVNGQLAIPNFPEFCEDVVKIFEDTKKYTDGSLPDYIPELQKVDPNLYGISFCTVDGQMFSYGDWKVDFPLQAAALPLVYCIACDQNGISKVHENIGREPSGAAYNAFTLNAENKPHNPMINTGGIVCCSTIQPENNPSARFGNVFDCISQMAGGRKMLFQQRIYLSEKGNADRNRALAYFMRGRGVKGLEGNKISEVLDFYFQVCSVACNTQDLSVIAGTLANGGKCPITGKRVISTETVRACLSLLYSTGMYDYSGQWAFTVGLPAKSGVSGALMVIIPNVLGMAIYSPRIDQRGNSVRGIQFCKQLAKEFSFSIFDQLVGAANRKVDPTVNVAHSQSQLTE